MFLRRLLRRLRGLFPLTLVAGDPFLTLGIETSCDDTAVAVLEGPRRILAAGLSSQVEDHAPHGGVVPELASRKHQEAILPLLHQVLNRAGIRNPARELHLVAVTSGPGLMGSLLVGVMTAKALSQAWEVPLVSVNHLEGHLFANVVAHGDLKPPFLCLIVSGGHTEILLVRAFGDYQVLGGTRDDAAGEAYDKVAKLLGLGYPGGPVVDRLAATGNPEAFPLPVPLSGSGAVEFSFSGLKTAVLWVLKRLEKDGLPVPVEDLCASFQRAAVVSLLEKTRVAVEQTGVRQVALSGGVGANSALRAGLEEEGARRGWRVYLPPRDLCTDNGVMIAAAGYSAFRRGIRCDVTFAPDPSWELNA